MLKIILQVLIIYFKVSEVFMVRPTVQCGYKQCPLTKDGALNVHLIPHSHMDAGWVKTFDEYYYGTRTSVSTANVQLIFHSVLSELLHDKRRKFTFSETAFFWRWWKEQRPGTRSTFRALVQEGRIEFAGGGWAQNDEATLDYLQIIDLFTWGLRKINDTLGPCGKPKAAWQIDTYGHTREQSSLLAQMGFDGLFVGRVDHKEREAMLEEDRMEFMWRGSDVLGKMSDIMTHTLFNLYNAPEGFCFDILCSDEPIVDDPDNRVYNADKRINDFIAQIERQAKYYDHDNIMVTMGGDFTYQSAANWYMNMDKLINYINTHPANISDINVFYSTPSCYLKAIYLYGRRDKAIYTERNDHLPYGSDTQTYWTGYYTSRPSLKYFVRRAHMFLQIVKQLTVITKMGDSFELHLLRHAANLVLHHDAITGTSQQHVTNDFIRMLSEAVDACTKRASNLLTYLTPTWGGSRRTKNHQQFVVCHEMNISQCRFTETQESMLLLVYNPLSIKIYHHIRMPAIALHYSIRDFNDEEVEYQLVPLPAAVTNVPGRMSAAVQELYFEAENIPPLGYAAFYIAPVRAQLEEHEFAKKLAEANKNPAILIDQQEIIPNIANEYVKVFVNKETGLLEWIQLVDGLRIQVSQNFFSYPQTQQQAQSGAYSFRPDKDRPVPVTQKATYHAIRGTIIKEIRQRFTDWITQVIRLYRGEEFVEIEWLIGPVPIGNDLGKEIVSIFSTNITNNGQFYTDSNGRQMMKRTCWNESTTQQQKKPVSACYYPVTSRICIQSSNTSAAMCVLTDRTQGGTSFEEGQIELMVHRRLLTDDGFGLEESLNEEAHGVGLVVKGVHRIFFGNYRQEVEDQTFSERIAQSARRWQMEPWLFFSSGEKVNRKKWQNVRNKRFSALRIHGLPRFIHVLTLEPWKSGSVLLRLENTLETPLRGRFRDEKPEGVEDFLNKPSHITVNLRTLFSQLKIRKVRETTLAANQWLDDARQMDWSTRYVYNGADDDIFPEDLDLERQDKTTKERNGERSEDDKDEGYSDEEADTHRKRPSLKHQRPKERKSKPTTYDAADRRKRSLNTSNKVHNHKKRSLPNNYRGHKATRDNHPRRHDTVDFANDWKYSIRDIVQENPYRQKRSVQINSDYLPYEYNIVDGNDWNPSLSENVVQVNNYRQKRGLNSSENMVEYILNATFSEPNEMKPTKETETTVFLKSTVPYDITGLSETQRYDRKLRKNSAANNFTVPSFVRRVSSRYPTKMKFMKNRLRPEPAKFFADLDGTEEAHSSEEDFSHNLKKRGRNRKSNKRKSVNTAAAEEEDVTKSIFEMYYKSKPRIRSHAHMRSSAESDFRPRRPESKRQRPTDEEDRDNSMEKRVESKRGRYTEIEERLKHEMEEYADEKRKRPQKARRTQNKDRRKNRNRYSPSVAFLRDAMDGQFRRRRIKGDDDGEDNEERRPKKADASKSIQRTKRPQSKYQEDYDSDHATVNEDGGDHLEDETDMEVKHGAMWRRKRTGAGISNNDETGDHYEDDRDMDLQRRKRATPDRANEESPHETPNSEHEPDRDRDSGREREKEEEPEYVITLRPTQIRTFVIWFHNYRGTLAV